MSIYLALHTSASPTVQDVADFGAAALALGAPPTSGLAVTRDSNGALTVVVPLDAATANAEHVATVKALTEQSR